MKKLMFALVIGTVLLTGCKTVEQSTVSTTESQQLEAEKPMVWSQSLFPNLEEKDPVVFLNSKDIIIGGDFSSKTFFLKDGAIYRMDSIQTVTKTVPALTPGKIVSLKKTNGIIQEMNISFSQSDITYTFNFRLKQDGSFTLNANAKLFFQGKEYKDQASTRGGECLLLVNFFAQKNTNSVNESAEGQSVSGTKIIK